VKISKLAVPGILLCLISIYFKDSQWLMLQGFEWLPGISIFIFIAGVGVTVYSLVRRSDGD